MHKRKPKDKYQRKKVFIQFAEILLVGVIKIIIAIINNKPM
jgi:hypothetical protein